MGSSSDPHQVVIIGGGFGGLNAARALRRAPVSVTLVDQSNHHLFQPLLYQVATAGLSSADIAIPIRSVLRKQKNATVLMSEVVGIDTRRKKVLLRHGPEIPYDTLVVATGARHAYFGRESWERFAPGLKSLYDATTIRRKILTAFEAAELETDPQKQRAWLNFVIVGGGPTGVELAGSIAELARVVLVKDFRRINPGSARVILIEAGPRVLSGFSEDLSERAKSDLKALGVEVMTGKKVEHVDARGIVVAGESIPSKTVIWAAGVVASPAGEWLQAETDRAGRVKVLPDLTVPGHPEVFVIGDAAHSIDEQGNMHPGVAPVAIQQGRFVGRLIRKRLKGEATDGMRFRYVDKGNLATIGRSRAIGEFKKLHLSGLPAWLVWIFVHILYLIGFKNKIVVMFNWAWSYFTFRRGARLITPEPQAELLEEADASSGEKLANP